MSVTTESADLSPVERLIVEQARIFARELVRAADDAPDGEVLRLAEQFVVSRGREFLRASLENVLQGQGEPVEKKTPPRGPVPAAAGVTTRGNPASNA